MEQFNIRLESKSRGFHLITREILSNIPDLPQQGIFHLFIQHTSAGICINENADPTVLMDMNNWFDRNIKENEPYYQHVFEGADDMPAHIKSVLTGTSISIPIVNGKLALGTWQGIYLGEFRDHASGRNLIVSILE
ncbi:secondary thiamine-phosphate synthase enzyme YjbQ [Paracrocinitomix mangrovi]|uniref:secondary thiamine-phosphate synthase enzyme YjbQ n=1 Tax=Paracrocinitomix mangrovi TaxID=2862509 RepID=UPI001C8E3972|nr:secondary thiamine-phosphate synthase enzyme YjbQ [Paracrocinitomix mangrovi]UKN02631.1 secondary thiamine-phosphate synthase enzyme YjbQ [Paracrocinitomix mangrovi]